MKVVFFVLGMLFGVNACMAVPMINDLVGKAVPQHRVDRKLRCLDKCSDSSEFQMCVDNECNYWYEK